MNKLELIQALTNSGGLSKSEGEKIVGLFFNEIGLHMGVTIKKKLCFNTF